MHLSATLKDSGFTPGDRAFIRIFKQEAQLELWLAAPGQTYRLFRSYPVCAMSGTLGPKLREGDKQAPEGFYAFGEKSLNPKSRFHLAFNIGYPNAYDRAHGRTGSFIMVHGNCVSEGCFAMTDPLIEEIYGTAEAALHAGQPFIRVHIFPFRMTEENLARYRSDQWYNFWLQLKTGYDSFERRRIPPEMDVKNGAYVIHGQETL